MKATSGCLKCGVEQALSDGKQSLNFKEFEELMKTVKSLAEVMGVNLV